MYFLARFLYEVIKELELINCCSLTTWGWSINSINILCPYLRIHEFASIAGHPGCFWNSGNLLDEATGNEKKRMVRSIHASCDQVEYKSIDVHTNAAY